MTYRFTISYFCPRGWSWPPTPRRATADQILPLVQCDLGLAFIPESMAREAIQKRQIVQIHLREEIPPRQICLVYDRQRPMSAAARQLKTTLLKERTD